MNKIKIRTREIINGIEEGEFGGGFEGFLVNTSQQVIKLGISNYQDCCEDWGYLMSEDDLDDFIGSHLLSIKVVDTGCNVKTIEAGEGLYGGCAMFINLETSKGLLQFVAYNSHNGYYGHEAVTISKQLNHSECL